MVLDKKFIVEKISKSVCTNYYTTTYYIKEQMYVSTNCASYRSVNGTLEATISRALIWRHTPQQKNYDANNLAINQAMKTLEQTYKVDQTQSKNYLVNTYARSYKVEIVDAESRYLRSRRRDDGHEESVIPSPMPGKVVKVLVEVGDKVKAGDTVIIVSAMKMESEYKVKKDRTIKEIKVKAGDTIEANQPLVIIE